MSSTSNDRGSTHIILGVCALQTPNALTKIIVGATQKNCTREKEHIVKVSRVFVMFLENRIPKD